MRRKAFTLIELLVVIAIIAILAAILFPVFAQAKAAAKKSASISNSKQVMTSSLLYEGDSDDMVPIITNWGSSGAYVSFGGSNATPWTQLVQPYMKSVQLFQDPQAPNATPPPAGFNPQLAHLFGTNYGLNPYMIQTAVYPYNSNGSVLHSVRNMTSISRPADTVMFTQKYSNAETSINNFYGGYWYGPGSFMIGLSTDPPDCAAPGNFYWCAAGWNDNGFYGGAGGIKHLKNVEAAGAFTGGGSMRGPKQMVVAFADGHVASKAPGYLAEGTAYNGARNGAGMPTQTQDQIVITDMTREHYYGIQ